MRIVEIYRSNQGEGLLTGVESVFIRASGCNLRCWFCDTPYASWRPEGNDLSIDEILAQVEEWDCGHIVITGGEPMLFAELVPLTQSLRARDKHITIETAGTLHLPAACDLMSISPKLSNSGPSPVEHPRWAHRHEESRHRPAVVRRLMDEYPYQLKFVIDTPGDCDEVEAYLKEIRPVSIDRVLMMPQGIDRASLEQTATWLAPLCDAKGWRYCPRRHIEWYGAVRGT